MKGKNMKIVATIALAVGLVFVASCGTYLSGGATLAQARSTCIKWVGTATTTAEADTNTFILIAQAGRDSGDTEADYLVFFLPDCSDNTANFGDPSGCNACITQVGAAVWN